MNELLNNLWQNQRPLILAGFGFLVATGILASLMLFDSTQILGINRWVKPIKFSSSAAIFLLTVAVYLYYLPNFERSKNVVAWGTILIMFGEVFLITMQATRGITSHFNTANLFDAMIFSMMGFMITVNTFLIIYLAVLYFQSIINLPNAIVWGMRLGLIVFILGSIQGGYMSSQTGHTIGVADGGAGLPFINWSTIAGDLRVAHFMGLHAFQIIPLVAVLLIFINKHIPIIKPTLIVVIFTVVYFSAFTLVFAQALRGKPFIKAENCQIIKLKNQILRG